MLGRRKVRSSDGWAALPVGLIFAATIAIIAYLVVGGVGNKQSASKVYLPAAIQHKPG